MKKFISPAKVNICLRVLNKRGDGYHNIWSIFLPIKEPHDEVEIVSIRDSGIKIECNVKELERENILFKVYEEFGKTIGKWPGIFVKLNKRIPIGGGLGGGSSNAACLLKYLSSFIESSNKELVLKDIAKRCGADIPFFLKGKPCIVEGIGDRLTEIDLSYDDFYLIVLCPDIEISTAWAYKKLDEKRKRPSSEVLTINTFDIKNPSRLLDHIWINDFEEVVFNVYKELLELKALIYRLGAKACVLSGSGAALVSLFSRQISLDMIHNVLTVKKVRVYVNKGV